MNEKANTRILVVEDRSVSRRILKDFLESNGYVVSEAKNGQECIRLALHEKPNLILLDLSIPVIDGWETARLIKSNKTTKQIPIIAITAHTLAGDRERALSSGCDDYVPKPLNHDFLLQRIHHFLR